MVVQRFRASDLIGRLSLLSPQTLHREAANLSVGGCDGKACTNWNFNQSFGYNVPFQRIL